MSILRRFCVFLMICVGGWCNGADSLVIREAVYGAFPEGNKVDVLKKVAELVKDGALRLEVGNDLFGDPASNVGKKLAVKCELNGKPLEVTIDEGETLLLPQPKLIGELKILSAVYGELPDGSTYEVLKLVKRYIKDNKLEIAVDNDMFGDPAPGAFKRLRVEYQVGEVKLAKSVYEGGKMTIAIPIDEASADALKKVNDKKAEEKKPTEETAAPKP